MPAYRPGRASVKTFSSPPSFMEIVAALLLAFGLAAYLRSRRWPALRAIVLASLLSPLTITFGAYVFPAEPEFRIWWHITVVTSVFFGLCAAAAGYVLVVLCSAMVPNFSLMSTRSRCRPIEP